jgi:hypothetical protein
MIIAFSCTCHPNKKDENAVKIKLCIKIKSDFRLSVDLFHKTIKAG